jgi:hypothetical protein
LKNHLQAATGRPPSDDLQPASRAARPTDVMAVFDGVWSAVGWAALIVFVWTSAWRAWQAVRAAANRAIRTVARAR